MCGYHVDMQVSGMTEKQKRFCDEYLIDLNATQAAIRAGYSEKTAYTIGQKLTKKDEIKSYIDAALERLHAENVADAQEVMRYLTSVMRGEWYDRKTEEVIEIKNLRKPNISEYIKKRTYFCE